MIQQKVDAKAPHFTIASVKKVSVEHKGEA